MSIALEADAVIDAIIANLLADTGVGGVSHAALTGGRVFRDEAPVPTTPYPLVTVSLVDARDNNTADGTHVLQNVLVLTKVTGKHTVPSPAGGNYGLVLAIARRIANRINMLEATTQGDTYIGKIWRDSMPSQPGDTVGGIRYYYHNQIWRAVAEPA